MKSMQLLHDDMENESLIRALRALSSSTQQDLPEWKLLIQLGGLLSDAIRALSRKYPDWNCDEIESVIAGAIEYHLLTPMQDELNAAWHDWEHNDTGKYVDVQTADEMLSILMPRIEQDYPDFMIWFRHCFHLDDA